MNYHDVMDVFSQCGLGAILVAEDDTVLDVNDAGEQLLHSEEKPHGKTLAEAAPFLLCGKEESCFGNPSFNQYLLPCPTPDLTNLPPNTRMLVFRDATKDFRHDLLESVFNQVSEAITVWDDQCRILMLNDAAVKLEAHLINNVIGKHVTTLYEPRNNTILVIPRVVEEKKPVLNLRQDFTTHTGKELQILSNNYPIFKNNALIGASSLMEDWTRMDQLNKQIIDLQRKLMGRQKSGMPAKANVLPAKFCFNDIVYSSPAMKEVIAKCKRVARSDSSAMFYGETGTGKELFAQSIHNASRRAERPFIALNCAAIPDTLLESLLFGTEKGAYTGAERREGLFEQAHTGTLLLDEINSMNVALQSKLLRVLQDGQIRRVGGTESVFVDVRILSNINIPPQEAIQQNLLRQDLFHRLGVVTITIPPLRERKQDIMLLVKTFIDIGNKKSLKNVSDIDPQAYELLHEYDWPGNVRELEHAVEYALIMIPDEMRLITREHLPDHIQMAVTGQIQSTGSANEAATLESVMKEAGARFLRKVLLDNGRNVTKAAAALGMTRQNFQQRMKRLGLKLENL